MKDLASALAQLPDNGLRALEHGLEIGELSTSSSAEKLATKLGVSPDLAQQVVSGIALLGEGLDPKAAAAALLLAVRSLVQERSTRAPIADLVQLALSGPQCNSQPLRTTAATFSSLVSEAQSHVLVTGYVAVNAKKLLEPLAHFLDGGPNRTAMLVLDFQRGKDSTVPEEFVARRADEFWDTEWPGSTRRPKLCYDTRSLAMDPKLRTSMHAKVVVADRRTLFVTSANLTHRAHTDNIEIGLVLRHAPTAMAVVDYFEGLMHRGILRSCGEPT